MKKILLLIMFSTLLLTGCTSDEDTVVIYTSMDEERNQELKEKVKEKFPEVDVEVLEIVLLK